jgi:hypothetical protein
MTDVLRSAFLPNRAITGAPEGGALDALARVAPIARDRVAKDGLPTAYVCEHGACQLPATDAADLAAAIAPVKPL